ncbi:MAG TPA: SdrD B-like domain-containing protein, partial [Anaerolineales bacterium]|nr:SdrD B-like domain-containing protein [Anaerolineales bacterium]
MNRHFRTSPLLLIVSMLYLTSLLAGTPQLLKAEFSQSPLATVTLQELPLNPIAQAIPDDIPYVQETGRTVAVDGDTLVAGAPECNSLVGCAYIFVRSNGNWVQQQKLEPSPSSGNDGFGVSVAISGDTVAVGASSDGSVHIFTRSGTSWSLQQKITTTMFFGYSVALEGDTLLVGNHMNNQAYVYTRSGTTWSLTQTLSPSVGGGTFGIDVALSGDTAVIGDSGYAGNKGALFVFRNTAGSWSEEQILTAPDGANYDYLGTAVSIDGNTVITSSTRHNSSGLSSNGAAYLFTRSGTSWSLQQELFDPKGKNYTQFGTDVAVLGDLAVVGAGADDVDSTSSPTYLYRRVGGTWSLFQTLSAPDGLVGNQFGSSLDFSSNGTLAIGAPGAPVTAERVGAVYIMETALQQAHVWLDVNGDGATTGENDYLGPIEFQAYFSGTNQMISRQLTSGGRIWIPLSEFDLAVRLPFAATWSGDLAGDGIASIDSKTTHSYNFGIVPLADANHIAGIVYDDYNKSGSFDFSNWADERYEPETGMAGVLVTAYNPDGSIAATDTTDASGTYVLNLTGNASTEFRIVFSNTPSGYYPSMNGSDNQTSVVFAAKNTNVNYGIYNPTEYREAVRLVTNNTAQTTDEIYRFNYLDGSVPASAISYATIATNTYLGNTYGLAWQPTSDTLFASTYFGGRHTAYGTGGAGAIYQVPNAYARPNAGGSLFVDLASLGINAGPATVEENSICALPYGNNTWERNCFNDFGSRSLGDMELSNDEQTLFVVNLFQDQLVALNIGVPATAPTSATPYSIPRPANCPTAEDFMPLGLGISPDNKLYISATCIGRSTQSFDNLRGYIYEWDLAGAFPTTPVLDFALNYPRRVLLAGSNPQTRWQYWHDFDQPFTKRRSPLLADIAVTANGLAFSIMDAYGPTMGDAAWASGDILSACKSGGSWVLEANGACGAKLAHPYGKNNYDGPANGETYWFEEGVEEDSIGSGLAALPNYRYLAVNGYDIQAFGSWQGVTYLDNQTGYRSSKISDLNANTGMNGQKNAVLGDVEALWQAPRLEIGNRIWEDTDGDGEQDAGEPPLAGVQVQLFSGTTLLATATTDSNGNYYFSNQTGTNTAHKIYGISQIVPGATLILRVDASQPAIAGYAPTLTDAASGTEADWVDNDASIVTNSAQITLTLSSITGENNHTFDFGFIPPVANIGNHIWNDTTPDGIYDKEPNLANVTVYAYWFGQDGTFGTADDMTFSAVTDSNGIYNIPVPAGEFYVQVEQSTVPPGMTQILLYPSPNSDEYNQEQLGDGYYVKVNAGDSDLTADFGYIEPVAEIGNYVWLDVDADGEQDAGELGVPNVGLLITWIGPDGNYGTLDDVTFTTTTDADGHYLYPVPAGVFFVKVDVATLPIGYLQTPVYPSQGTDGYNQDQSDYGYKLEVLPGGSNLTADFGYLPPTSALGNYVWVDEDSNGYQDAGEPGLPNVAVLLTWFGADDTFGTADDRAITTVTDANGQYLFRNLPAGNFYVQVQSATVPTGMTQTTTYPKAAADGYNQDQSGSGYHVNLALGQTDLSADFGYNYNPTSDVKPAGGAMPPAGALSTIAGKIWVDVDNDLWHDTQEVGLRQIQVTLLHDPDGNGIFDTPYTGGGSYNPVRHTDSQGNYLFDNLPAGQYVVKITDEPAIVNWLISYSPSGDPDLYGTTIPSPDWLSVNGDLATTTPIVLEPGDVYMNANFGAYPNGVQITGSIGDTVWFDADANGVQDAGESFFAGVTVSLIADLDGDGVWDSGEPVIASTETNGAGNYLFNGLPIVDGTGTDDYLVWVNDARNILSGMAQTYDADGLASPAAPYSQIIGLSHVTDLTFTPNLSQDFGYTIDGSGQRGPSSPLLNLHPGMIGDTIWLDINSDGAQSSDEPGIAGVRVQLTLPDNTVLNAITGTDGKYLFANLPADADGEKYTVTVAASNFASGGVLAGLAITADPDGGADHSSVVTLTATSPLDLSQDFGYLGDGKVGNLIWLDINANGIYEPDGVDGVNGTADDEIAIGNVTVDLYRDSNGNGVLDAGEPWLATTTSHNGIDTGNYGTDGNYIFTGLSTDFGAGSANYVVVVTDRYDTLNGYWHTLGASTTDNNSQPSPYAVNISPGDTLNLTADFGYYILPASLGNRVWMDSNSNGIQDPNEVGINGAKVLLTIDYGNGDILTLQTVTRNDPQNNLPGWYNFSNLMLDENYTGENPNEPSFTLSVMGLLNSATQIDVSGNSQDYLDSEDMSGAIALPHKGTHNFTFITPSDPLTEYNPAASYDFGVTPSASALGNKVWLDENSDGFQDVGERGIANVIVDATWAGQDGQFNTTDDIVISTYTDTNGGYLFANIPSGKYWVQVRANTLPVGMTQTTTYPHAGADQYNQDQSGTGYAISLLANQANLTADFGYNYNPTADVNPASGIPPQGATVALGDRVWIDVNSDGTQDMGEIGVSGVELTLFYDPENDGTFTTPYTVGGYTATTVTDVAGYYIFDNLPIGAYAVSVTSSALASHDVLGGLYLQTGDPDEYGVLATVPDNTTTYAVILGPGDVFSNVDFGYQPNGISLGALGGSTNAISFDANGNGYNDGESPLAGVSVALIKDLDGDGVWDAGEPVIASTLTDAWGGYLFQGLPTTDGTGTDDYFIWVNDTAHITSQLTQTDDDNGLNLPISPIRHLGVSTFSDLDEATYTNYYFSYTATGTGIVSPSPVDPFGNPGGIGDTIWLDTNGNATQDANEYGIAGVVVRLTFPDSSTMTAVTNEDGRYLFPNLSDDNYTITILSSNFAPGGALAGLALTSDPDGGDDNTSAVSVAGGYNLYQDFGYRGTGQIGNLLWNDLNADGIYQPDGQDGVAGTLDDENPIGDVTIDLYRDVNGNGLLDIADTRIASTVTDGAIDASYQGGNYLFDGLSLDDGDGSANYLVDVTDRNGVLGGYWN